MWLSVDKMIQEITAQQLLGQTNSHISADSVRRFAKPVHHLLCEPLANLQADAQAAGFDLRLVSGFRDYTRQWNIWHDKAHGLRPVLDQQGLPCEPDKLNGAQLLQCIMRWSALPGASRHHWGTDIDVYDAAAVAEDFSVQLTPQEVEGEGPFVAFHDWLDERIANQQAHGFFRPYAIDRGGVSPERWHLSYAPLAIAFQRCLNKQVLLQAWSESGLPLLDAVLADWDNIWERYIWVPESQYPTMKLIY